MTTDDLGDDGASGRTLASAEIQRRLQILQSAITRTRKSVEENLGMSR